MPDALKINTSLPYREFPCIALKVESQWLLKRICAHVQYSLDFGNYVVFIEDLFKLFLRSRKALNKLCFYTDM